MLNFCLNSKTQWVLLILYMLVLGALVGYLRFQTRCIAGADVELEKLCVRKKMDWGQISKGWEVCEGDVESLHMA